MLRKNNKTPSRRHPSGLDWTASPISRDNGDDDEEEDKGDGDDGVAVDLMMIMLMMMVMMMMTKGEGGLDEQFGSGPRQLGHPSSCASLAYDEEKMNKI